MSFVGFQKEFGFILIVMLSYQKVLSMVYVVLIQINILK